MVWVTSDGLNGTLVIDTESHLFKVEPFEFPLSPDDVNMPIEITVYGNETLTPGVYEEKLTFIGYTGDVVAMGIKIRINVEQYSSKNGFSIFGVGLYQILGILLVILASIIFLNKNRGNKIDETSNI